MLEWIEELHRKYPAADWGWSRGVKTVHTGAARHLATLIMIGASRIGTGFHVDWAGAINLSTGANIFLFSY